VVKVRLTSIAGSGLAVVLVAASILWPEILLEMLKLTSPAVTVPASVVVAAQAVA